MNSESSERILDGDKTVTMKVGIKDSRGCHSGGDSYDARYKSSVVNDVSMNKAIHQYGRGTAKIRMGRGAVAVIMKYSVLMWFRI